MATFWRTFHNDGKSAQPGEGGGAVHAHHRSLYLPSRTMLLIQLCPYMYSMVNVNPGASERASVTKFLFSGFFLNHHPPGPCLLAPFRIFLKFMEMFASQSAPPPVSSIPGASTVDHQVMYQHFWHRQKIYSRSRIHERTISLRFLDMILRVLRLEVSVYNVHTTNQFQTTFAQGGEWVKSVIRGDCE
jgi:hypothetical protein